MKTARAFVIGASVLGLAVTPAAADQQEQQRSQQQGQQQQGQQQQDMRAALVAADTLKGADIRDRQGREIGSIDRFTVDPQSGRIEQVLVRPGGGLGLGRDSVPVSWQDIDVKRDQQQVVLTMDRAVLEARDGAAASPRTDQPRGQQQTRPEARQQRLVDIDDLQGADIRDAQGQELGTANRLMIDPQDGRITYVVVATGGLLGFGRDHVQIPWQNLQVRYDNDQIVLNAERRMLEQAPVAERGWVRPARDPAASPGLRPGQQPQQPQQQRQQ